MASIASSSPSSSSSPSPSPSSPSVPASCSRSWKYDVFLSFRGEDTRNTFVGHLYSALDRRMISTYKDDETLPRGDTIGPSLFNAIADSQIALIIFSQNYANSLWCLDELVYIMKCREERGQIVMPIFYQVDPSDVRKQKQKYEEAFARHELENNIKTESWRKALVDASNIAGWETKLTTNGHEAKCIEDIVGTILDKLLSLNSVVDEKLVGMGTRMQDLKSKLEIGSGGVRMVGIWGIGGGGKTTLASSIFMEIRGNFDGCCFVGNIKEESSKSGMETLQGKILSTIFNKKVEVPSVDIGKHMIKDMLCRKNVLIVLDDVDDRKQLEALAGSHDWFGDGSRIIITTRDVHLLRTHRVDKVSHVSLLSDEEAIRLFNRHAYNEKKLVEDYKMLSQSVISYAAGLPLALVVLGSFLYDKDKVEWKSTLARLKDIPEMEIVEKLKISYDGLTTLEKELFLDIACFFRGRGKDEAMVMLDACGFHPGIGVKVLMEKGLVTIKSSHNIFGKDRYLFDMHDLVQEMGHYIVRKKHPNNPEKHSRLWRFEEIEDICSGNETTENNKTEAIICDRYPSDFHKLVSKAKKLRLLSLFNLRKGDIEVPEYLSNELRYMYWVRYPASPFPKSFQPRKLVVLKLEGSLQEELWRGNKSLPCLKELQLLYAHNLVRTPDFGGLPCLEKLTLKRCYNLEEIHPSFGNHTSLVYVYVGFCMKLRKFPTIVQMGKLEILKISCCDVLHSFPKIEANMDSLVNLTLKLVEIEALPSSIGEYCTKLRSLKLKDCSKLKSIEVNFHALKHLQNCKISGGKEFETREFIKLPKDLFNENIHLEELDLNRTMQPSIFYLPRFLRRLTLIDCGLKNGEIPCDIGELSNLQELDLRRNEFSRLNFSLSQLSQLKLLNLGFCRKLVELPELSTSIAILKADCCPSLEVVGDIHTNCKWLCQVSLRWGRSLIGGDRLLQSMLQGNEIENGCMSLHLEGLEIPKGFTPPLLLKGTKYRLQLPDNWYNCYSGFLMCAVVHYNFDEYIYMKHEKGVSTGMDSQEDVYWEKSYHDEATWVGYVSFGSLKHTLWWDPTSTAIQFSLGHLCSGFGVSLVSKRSESGQSETTTDSSSEFSNDYTCDFRIEHVSKSHLECLFGSYKRKTVKML